MTIYRVGYGEPTESPLLDRVGDLKSRLLKPVLRLRDCHIDKVTKFEMETVVNRSGASGTFQEPAGIAVRLPRKLRVLRISRTGSRFRSVPVAPFSSLFRSNFSIQYCGAAE